MVENPENKPRDPDPLEMLSSLLVLRHDNLETWKVRVFIDQTLLCVYEDCHQAGLGHEADVLVDGIYSDLPPINII